MIQFELDEATFVEDVISRLEQELAECKVQLAAAEARAEAAEAAQRWIVKGYGSARRELGDALATLDAAQGRGGG